MLALEVEYLMGRVVASRRDDRRSVEWPPHPTRLFSALVSACWEADLREEDRESSRAALKWLEQQSAPCLAAWPPRLPLANGENDPYCNAGKGRDVPELFVPVNDHPSDGNAKYWQAQISKNEMFVGTVAQLRKSFQTLVVSDRLEHVRQAIKLVRSVLGKKGLGLTDKKKQEFVNRASESSQKSDRADQRRETRLVIEELLALVTKSHSEMLKECVSVLPARRSRQERWFPAFTPEKPVVYFIWPDAKPEKYGAVLEKLAQNVTYLGHSMSPVRVAVVDEAPAKPNLVPEKGGDLILRVPGPGKGRLQYLEEIHQIRLRNSTVQPRLGRTERYKAMFDAETEQPPRSVFTFHQVFRRTAGESLALDRASALTATVRRTLMSISSDPRLEVLSGHDSAGRPSLRPHMAIVPLADVGHRRADRMMKGFAVLLPKNLSDEEREVLEAALADLPYCVDEKGEEAPRKLKLGALGQWEIAQVDAYADVPKALWFGSRYAGLSDTWASVTPVVFGHFPDRRGSSRVVPGGTEFRPIKVDEKRRLKLVGEMCADIDLPRPIEVRLGSISALHGVPRVADFLRPKQAENRLMTHLWARFDRPVRGPVVLGAGRYLGLGLMRPIRQAKEMDK